MKKNKKWTVLALICLLMLMVLPVKAETTGSIAIQLHSDAAEVEMTLYKVAAYADEEYTMTEEFQGCGITTKQLLEAKNVSQITETLEKYVAAQKLKGIQKTKKQMKYFFMKDSLRDCILQYRQPDRIRHLQRAR